MKPPGPALRRARRRRGLTQQQVAARAKLSQSFLSELETGQRGRPSFALIARLAKVLGIDLDELAK
jgi:transcriptional regulator with XRE-family HTH domain